MVYVVIFRVIVMLKNLSRSQYTNKLFKKFNKMEPIHFTTMPNFRGPTTSGRRTIDEVNDSLRKRIQRDMPWAQIHTRKGKTQESESKYINHFIKAILKEGGTIESFAGSQRSKDIRGVRYPGVDGIFDYEGKKIDGRTGNFCLNDTIPSGNNVYYIFLRVDGQSVDIRKASELVNDEYVTPDHYSTALDELSDCVERLRSRGNSSEVSNFQELFRITVKLLEVAVKSGMMSLYDYGQLFKFTTNFGFFKSRPRPNWFLSTRFLSRLREEDDEVPLNILRERLTRQSSE